MIAPRMRKDSKVMFENNHINMGYITVAREPSLAFPGTPRPKFLKKQQKMT